MLDYILLGGFLGIFMCVIILIMLSNGFIGIVIRTSILIIIFLLNHKNIIIKIEVLMDSLEL